MRNSRIFPLLIAVVAAGCGDTLGPTAWNDAPDTVKLYSASRAQYSGLQSAFDLTTPRPVVAEAAGGGGTYDFLVLEQNGGFALAPEGALTGVSNRAGLVPVTASAFTDIRKAPTDTGSYKQLQPVPVRPGDFLVVRSRRVSCIYTTGSYYAKLQVLATDAAAGTLTLAYVRNPYCSDQSLVPPGK